MEARRSHIIAKSNRAYLGALREAQIVSSKPVFPAEIFTSILDFVNAEDLATCAQVSKRMREMVYDDTRWVRRLQMMGAWSEAAARRRAEQISLSQLALKGTRQPLEDLSHIKSPRKETPLIMLNSPTTPTYPKQHSSSDSGRHADDIDDPTNSIVLSRVTDEPSMQLMTPDSALSIIESIKSQRGKAREEYGKVHAVLAPFYKDAAICRTPSSAKLFRSYRDPEHQARMLSQLIRFGQADISPGWTRRQSRIVAVCSAFEDAITAEFEDGMQRHDVDGKLKKYAHVLFHLNGASRAISIFLDSNIVLASPYKLGDPTDCISTDSARKFIPDEYLNFLRRLANAVNDQCEIMDRVFPQAADVSEVFIEQVGEVVLRPYLLKLFDALRELSREQFIKATSETYLQNMSFLETIKSAPRLMHSETLRKSVQSFYDPKLTEYLDEEVSWFKRRSETEVTGWERQLSQQDASLEAMYMAGINRQADKRDFLSSFKKVVMAPVNILPTISFGAKPVTTPSGSSGLHAPSRSASRDARVASGFGDSRRPESLSRRGSRSPSPAGEPPTTELEAKAAIMQSRLEGIKTLFSLEVALSLVHMAKVSIERMAIFANNSAGHKEAARVKCESVFILLLETLDRHVRSGFNQAVEHMAGYNPRSVESRDETQMVTPLMTFLELVNVGDLIQQMIDVFFEQELVAPQLTDKNDFLNETVKAKKKFEQMLDDRVAAGLNKGIEVLVAEIEYICATTQNAEDYNPGATGKLIHQIVDVSTTNTARWVVDLVSTHVKMLTGSADKNMLEVFNQEVGLRLFGTLCKHLKRQRISVAGAPRLMSDMNHYFVFIHALKNQDLLQYFKALRELSQIYLIDGNNAKELATVIADHDRYSGIFNAEEVLRFAERRSDWYQVRPKVEKAMYGIGCRVM